MNDTRIEKIINQIHKDEYYIEDIKNQMAQEIYCFEGWDDKRIEKIINQIYKDGRQSGIRDTKIACKNIRI